MQVNKWLTMTNRRSVRQFDPVLRDDTRPEPVRRMAVRQPPVQEDHVHEAHAVVHGGEPDVRAEGIQDNQEVHHQEDAWQGGQVAADVRDDVHTAGDDDQDQGRQDDEAGVDDIIVQANEAHAAHDDTNDAVIVGPEVPKDEEGGEADPVQGMFETGGLKSKMTKQELFDPGGGGGGIAKSRGLRAFNSVANCSFLCPRDPSHVHLLSRFRSEYNLVID